MEVPRAGGAARQDPCPACGQAASPVSPGATSCRPSGTAAPRGLGSRAADTGAAAAPAPRVQPDERSVMKRSLTRPSHPLQPSRSFLGALVPVPAIRVPFTLLQPLPLPAHPLSIHPSLRLSIHPPGHTTSL